MRFIPTRIHAIMDYAVALLLLAASPWLVGFADTICRPHLIIGLAEIAVAIVTKTQPTGSGAQPIIG